MYFWTKFLAISSNFFPINISFSILAFESKNENFLFFILYSPHLFVSLQSNSGTLTAFLMAANIFKGLGIALVTPFHADGSIDFDALDRLLDYQLDNGTDFFCILATTGETPCLTTEEKHLIITNNDLKQITSFATMVGAFGWYISKDYYTNQMTFTVSVSTD